MLKDDFPLFLLAVQNRRRANVDLPAALVAHDPDFEEMLERDERRIAKRADLNLLDRRIVKTDVFLIVSIGLLNGLVSQETRSGRDDDLGLLRIVVKCQEFVAGIRIESGDPVFDNFFRSIGKFFFSVRCRGKKYNDDKGESWYKANEYLDRRNSEKLGGHDDWRLPTKMEIQSIYEIAKTFESRGKTYTLHIDPIFEFSYGSCFWTKTTRLSAALGFEFDVGDMYWYPQASISGSVRAVRLQMDPVKLLSHYNS